MAAPSALELVYEHVPFTGLASRTSFWVFHLCPPYITADAARELWYLLFVPLGGLAYRTFVGQFIVRPSYPFMVALVAVKYGRWVAFKPGVSARRTRLVDHWHLPHVPAFLAFGIPPYGSVPLRWFAPRAHLGESAPSCGPEVAAPI